MWLEVEIIVNRTNQFKLLQKVKKSDHYCTRKFIFHLTQMISFFSMYLDVIVRTDIESEAFFMIELRHGFYDPPR